MPRKNLWKKSKSPNRPAVSGQIIIFYLRQDRQPEDLFSRHHRLLLHFMPINSYESVDLIRLEWIGWLICFSDELSLLWIEWTNTKDNDVDSYSKKYTKFIDASPSLVHPCNARQQYSFSHSAAPFPFRVICFVNKVNYSRQIFCRSHMHPMRMQLSTKQTWVNPVHSFICHLCSYVHRVLFDCIAPVVWYCWPIEIEYSICMAINILHVNFSTFTAPLEYHETLKRFDLNWSMQ